MAIGVNADANSSIRFSMDAKNIPTEINIYLEDKIENTYTKLNDNNDYEITLSEAQNGLGRFYLHTTSQVLDIEEDFSTELETTKIWLSENSILDLTNLPEGKSTLKVFDLLGKELLTRRLSSREQSRGLTLQLPKTLKTGIYLVRLKTEKGKKVKKIIVE